jgi:ABC-2 type transport system ATP-binding protein
VVACVGLSRRVGEQHLLDDVNLAIPPGARVLIYAQPEASGSLLLRCLAGLARMDAGSVHLAGVSRPDDSAAGWARRVAYVAPDVAVYPWFSPREALDLAGRLAGLERTERLQRIDEAAERFRLGGALDRTIRRGGPAVAQLTGLAAALLSEPEVLLLDEPLRAVDPDERRRLLRLEGKRRAVLLASRFPTTEAGLVNQVVLLRNGRVAAHLPVGELLSRGFDLSARGLAALAQASPLSSAAAVSRA